MSILSDLNFFLSSRLGIVLSGCLCLVGGYGTVIAGGVWFLEGGAFLGAIGVGVGVVLLTLAYKRLAA